MRAVKVLCIIVCLPTLFCFSCSSGNYYNSQGMFFKSGTLWNQYNFNGSDIKLPVPINYQESGNACGIACLKMIFEYYNDIPSSQRIDRVGIRNQGLSTKKMRTFVESLGDYYFFKIKGTKKEIYANIEKGRPLIVIQTTKILNRYDRHYQVIRGYGDEKLILNDPYSGLIEIKNEDFIDSWHQTNNLLILIVPKEL